MMVIGEQEKATLTRVLDSFRSPSLSQLYVKEKMSVVGKYLSPSCFLFYFISLPTVCTGILKPSNKI